MVVCFGGAALVSVALAGGPEKIERGALAKRGQLEPCSTTRAQTTFARSMMGELGSLGLVSPQAQNLPDVAGASERLPCRRQ